MQATSLSVNIPGPCNASCPFCISKLTGKYGQKFDLDALESKAFRYASCHGVDTVLITGKGEPTLRNDLVILVIHRAYQDGFPIIELQTNGYKLWQDLTMLETYKAHHLTTLSISIADFSPIINNEIIHLPSHYNYLEVIQKANELGFLCRVSLNMTNSLTVDKIKDGAQQLKAIGVHQLTLRELGIPNHYDKNDIKQVEVVNWIQKNSINDQELQKIIQEVENDDKILRTISYGPSVYDYQGLSAVVASCMTDNKNPEEIRSLIFQPNGHLYHSWNFEGSIIL